MVPADYDWMDIPAPRAAAIIHILDYMENLRRDWWDLIITMELLSPEKWEPKS